jgi:hypothetical protein
MTKRIVKIPICVLLHLEYNCPEDIESVTGLITSSTLALKLGVMLKVKL